MNIPTKSGWYRARWPGYTRWSCVAVTVDDSEVLAYDPGFARWRPASDIVEWGPNIDSLEAEIECLRTELQLANDTITNLRAAVDTLTTIASPDCKVTPLGLAVLLRGAQ